MAPTGNPSRNSGTASNSNTQPLVGAPDLGVVLVEHGQAVVDVDGLALENGSANQPAAIDRASLADRKYWGDHPIACYLP